MKAYFRALLNYKQHDWAKFLKIAGFPYNNAKNISTGHIFSKLHYMKKISILVSSQNQLMNYQ